MLIDIRDVYKIYGEGTEAEVRALDGVSLTVDRGEFVAVVGQSGSGKSTLMNILGCLDVPTRGTYLIDGQDVDELDDAQLSRIRNREVGFIFQSYNLLSTVNAEENVAMPLMFRGVRRSERLAKARKLMKLVGVLDQAEHMPNQMSGGQQQRVGIARALVSDPRIIFADEPTGNLDSRTSMDVLRLMQRLVREEKQTLVMVTHDDSIASYADKRIRISDGKIISMEENDGER